MKLAWLVVAAIFGAILSASLSTQAAPISLRDDSGQTVSLPGPAQRVVTLSPHLAELEIGRAHV